MVLYSNCLFIGCQYTGDKTPKTAKHISDNVISNSAKLCSEKNSFLSQFDESKRYTTNGKSY